MKSKWNLIGACIGVAMLATPVVAAAKDHHSRDERPYHEFRTAPNRTFVAAPAFRHGWKHEGWRDRDESREYRNEGWNRTFTPRNRSYGYPARGYAPYYGAPMNSGACAKAQVLANQYRKDRATGHPAAAADVLRQMSSLRNRGCTASAAPFRRGLYGGGYQGVSAYNNYGYNAGGYNAPYNGSGYNTYNAGGYNAPNYGSGYNGGMLGQFAPMLQQFVP
jgi:hypothetical protein